jgi:hypothetical protein
MGANRRRCAEHAIEKVAVLGSRWPVSFIFHPVLGGQARHTRSRD